MTTILKDQKIWFDGYDLTATANNVALQAETEVKDATVFGLSTRKSVAGLKMASLGVSGFWKSTPDNALFANLGAAGKLVSVTASGVEGDFAYMMKAVIGKYGYQGKQGDIFPYDLQAASAGSLLRGTLMENNTGISISGAGTARQIGPVVSGQKLYAGLHVFSVGGTTPILNLTVKTDAFNSFSGAEMTRITFDPVTDIGSQLKEVSGPITDSWGKITWSISGASAAFDFAVILAIL